ncbi:ABC transporter ATP-binding protein [Streptomyces sp. GC420]|uniref:ABC transporter ATP-binding protein n=1 Tax=Streptomyces sp. GC420 TaxID=2697568 RepID=UPI001414E4C1|nr:ABC transporter ATP-binding protein [Streptomyces sp. GC420]NBM16624.1 ATP-binding cassette domain-containing protein [Streptomyces sp. GC420]
MSTLLEVTDLTVAFPRPGMPPSRPVRGVNLEAAAGKTLGIVGETGCGKTLTGRAVLGLLPEQARLTGSIRFDGRELTTLPPQERAALRGGSISLVFQNPGTAFNPLFTIGRQVGMVARRHLGADRRRAEALVLDHLGRVGLPDPRRVAAAYPHELSGGMLQRAMIAMALISGPRLLILDEPTTALDVTVAQQILRLVLGLQAELGFTVLLITHNLGVVADVCDTTAVMYAGRVVEQGRTTEVLSAPRHPYTRGLIGALPGQGAPGRPLTAIPGTVPNDPAALPGCAFAARCPAVTDTCRHSEPRLTAVGTQQEVACFAETTALAETAP